MAHTPFHGLTQPGQRPSMQFQQLNQAYQSDPRRILGQTLMGQGASSAPVRTPLQGLGRLSSALVGAYLQRKAGDAQAARETEMTNQIMGMLGPNVASGVRAAVAANPAAAQSALLAAQLAPTVTSEITDMGDFAGVQTTTTSPLTGNSSTQIGNIVQRRAPTKQDFVTLVNRTDPTDVKTFQLGDPQINTLLAGNYVERTSSNAPTVNITQEAEKAGETEFAKGIAKAQVKQLESLSEKANLASENEDAINSILTLYNRAESQGLDLSALTGPGAEFKLDLTESLASIGGLFGFNYKELGIDVDKITDQQTLRAAFNKLSLEMTKLLRGAISEKELAVTQRATANFGNTPEANRIILLTQRGAAAKARSIETEAFRYIDENGNLGKGTIDGKEYNSFTQYQREFINRDKDFVVKQVIPEINSESEMKALIKIAGGPNALSDEVAQLMNDRLDMIQ